MSYKQKHPASVMVAKLSDDIDKPTHLEFVKPLAKNKNAIRTMINLHNQGYKTRDIGEMFGCRYQNIARILKHNGITFKYNRKRPSNIGNIVIDNGYKIEYVGEGFPGARKTGWISVHRKVMQQHLGRVLAPGEVIHHIDKDKLNNELSNLKLTTREEHPICSMICPYYRYYVEHTGKTICDNQRKFRS